jgi:ATP-dependent DNA helicase RecQ
MNSLVAGTMFRGMFEDRIEKIIKEIKERQNVIVFIDEAHCISHWGHDFREDYRNLGIIKEAFRPAAVHAFTATATEEVRKDILEQLRLEAPHIHVGPVDRLNLIYRVRPRAQIIGQ